MPISREDQEAMEMADKIRSLAGTIVKVAIGLVLVAALFGSWYTVEPTEVAVRTQLGRIVGVFGQGPHFKWPLIDSVEKFSIQVQRADIKTEAFSKDIQTMTAEVVVNYRVEQGTIESIYMNLGPSYVNTVVNPIVQETLKAITAKYSAEAIISNRMDIVKALNDEVKRRLLEKQIVVTDISIVDLAFQSAFMSAVESKQVAEQESLKAQKLVEKAKMEADQAIAAARAQAESLRLQKEQVTDKMIELKKVEVNLELAKRWNGKLPDTVVGGSGAIPLLDLSKMGK